MYKTITEKDSLQERLARYMQEELQRKDAEALIDLLNSESGRWFLMRLLDRTKVTADTFTGDNHTFYNEGMRKVGLLLLQDIASLGINAVKLKQRAEIEYIETQMRAREIATETIKRQEEG